MTNFWHKFGFGKCFGASSQSNHWAGYHRLLNKIHFSSPITIWSRNCPLLHRIREDDTSKLWFFLFLVSSWGTHLSSLFTFPICFKCWMIIERSTLSSLATSRVVVWGSASAILSVGCCQFPMACHCAPIFKALVSFAKLLGPALHCTFISSSWAKCIVDGAGCLRCFTTHFELE